MTKSPLQKMIAAADAKSMTRMLEAADVAQRMRHTATEAVVHFETLPPSKNRLTSVVPMRIGAKGFDTRRVKTREYKAWIDLTLEHILKVQRPPLVRGDVRVAFLFQTNRRLDLSNMLDAGADMLTRCGVIEDDQRIVSITMDWYSEMTGATATIRSA